jgi:hypothetical protein
MKVSILYCNTVLQLLEMLLFPHTIEFNDLSGSVNYLVH